MQLYPTDMYQAPFNDNFLEYDFEEHKYFLNEKSDKTVVTVEYPKDYQEGDERYYPMTDEVNQSLYRKYAELAKSDPNLHFGGRLGSYKYMNMDQVIAQAMKDSEVF